MKTLVLGIGNLLMGDEGVGVRIIERLREKNALPGLDVVDGGTGGFHLLDYFLSYERVILVDGAIDGKKPGSLSLLKPVYSSQYPPTLVSHDIGLKDLLDALLLLGKKPEIVLLTVTIARVESVRMDLSPEVQAAIEPAAQRIIDYLASLP